MPPFAFAGITFSGRRLLRRRRSRPPAPPVNFIGSPGPQVLVRPDGDAAVAAADLDFPHGSVITPDGSTLIVGETFGARLTAFDVRSDGTLAGRALGRRSRA